MSLYRWIVSHFAMSKVEGSFYIYLMGNTKLRIARNLDRKLSEMGFATQGVEALREGADVSLRTLYKYFPSREEMILGALDYRDGAYLDWISGGPADGADHALYPLKRLGDWLDEVANTGCLFMNALAAYPESQAIREAVLSHKSRLEDAFRLRLQHIAPDRNTEELAQSLFLLHEGLTEVARLRGPAKATAAAMRAARVLLALAGLLPATDFPALDG